MVRKHPKSRTTHPAFPAGDVQKLFTRIARSITASLEISEVVKAIMHQVQAFFRPKNWSLFRLDPVTKGLYFVVASGLDQKAIKNVRIKLGEGVVGRVAETGRSMIVKNTQKNTHFSRKIDQISGFKTQSLVAVPIVFQKKVLGVIELINTVKEGAFDQKDVMLLETIANFSAIAMMNALAYERMSMLAMFDALTGLYNRARLERLLKSIHRASHHAENKRHLENFYAIAVWVDLDKFKKINDTFGHRAGDEILQKSAILLRECCRENDYAFRVGGDEFLLLIMNLFKKDVNPIKKRLKNQLRQRSKEIAPAGFSFGIASGDVRNLPTLITKADDLMYIDKKSKSR